MPSIPDLLALALQHHHAGRLQEAEQIYRRILAAEPENAEAWNNLGNVLMERGLPADALPHYDRALQLRPNFAEAHYNLGNAQKCLGSLEAAERNYRTALRLEPALADAEFNLGLLLFERGTLEEAMDCFRRVIDLNPTLPDAQDSLGALHYKRGEPDEAEACFRKAVELDPDYAQGWVNLGVVLRDAGHLDEAKAAFERAISLKHNYADAHYFCAELKLLHGHFKEGWDQYGWRWKTAQFPARKFTQPEWSGEPLQGKSILIYAGQGFGDTIQFIRYAPLVKARGATVVVECQRPLRKLLQRCNGIDHLVASGDALPPTDFQAEMLTLPRVFSTTLDTIPADVPYVFPDHALVAEWREKLSRLTGLRIGINWRGRNELEARYRDIPLHFFSRLSEIPGVQLISLQKGTGAEELRQATGSKSILDLGEFDTKHGAFMDSAAIIQNLDLVITSDTSIAHLAGALGAQVWLAVRYIPEWRWLLGRTDSPWYPTMRLFRQESRGDWTGVFEQISDELEKLAGAIAGRTAQAQ